MKNLKKFMALALALVMVFALSANAFAATTDVYMTAGPNTAWSTQASAGGQVTLTAGPANSGWAFTGFSSAEHAESARWNFNCGENLVASYSQGSALTNIGTYVATFEITAKNNVYGPISVKATSAQTGSSVDLTAYVESAATISPVTVASVEVVDLTGDTFIYEYAENVEVKAASQTTANPFYSTEINSGSAQSYPTAGDALYSMMADGYLTFTQGGGYVGSISDNYDQTQADNYPLSWGWNYCVIRDGAIVEESRIVSASVLPVVADDAVYWAYGTMDDAHLYFESLV